MFVFTRMGWLVLFIWLSATCAAGQIMPVLVPRYFPGFSIVSAIFIAAAAVSSPLIFLLGILLNRKKVERKIKRFGKERTVYWGTHTFSMVPMEHFALIIPIVTAFFVVVFTFV